VSIALRKIITALLVAGPLVGTGYAVFASWGRFMGFTDLALLIGLYVLIAMGVTVGFHRYLTHGSFKTNRFLKAILTILGTMSLEGSPISWVANHRLHHAYADRQGDLHSPHLSNNPVTGFIHAHFSWLFADSQADPKYWAEDLGRDRMIVLISRYTILWWIIGLIIPYFIGGWSGLMWGGLVRVFLTHHVTWSVNSVCHIFGSRPFNTKDRSTNFWPVGLLAFGEGGHNTHHASPKSARHGLFWWHFDMSWVVIRMLEKTRLAQDVYVQEPVVLKQALRERAAGVPVVLRRSLAGGPAEKTGEESGGRCENR